MENTTLSPWASKQYKAYDIDDVVKVKQFNYVALKTTKEATVVKRELVPGSDAKNNAYVYDVLYAGGTMVKIRACDIEGSEIIG